MRQGNVYRHCGLQPRMSPAVCCPSQGEKPSDSWRKKHPPPSELNRTQTAGQGTLPPNSVIYEMITGEMVVVEEIPPEHGSAGPSGLDARGWPVAAEQHHLWQWR
ncbi:hypothetical protein GWK47_003406 [Chionoecetes opilio]|uniref:Uncharacterized protein n=1 Tax=Chionoecetes opilio TaxID=41210 RepID=A0A8J4YK62_CHIOP|nr:hypothetical protein GWK47_003406 [Chionoecetes opilio]